MANRKDFNKPLKLKEKRTFSDEFKRSKVQEIEKGISRVSEICKTYQVSSTSVYRWIHKYGKNVEKSTKTIVEAESDTRKIQELKNEVLQLEQSIGQKQVKLDFLYKMIERIEEEYQIDVKKKFGERPSSGSGKTGKS